MPDRTSILIINGETVEDKVFNVFIDILELPENTDKTSLIYNETKGWDSLGHMRLIAAIEENFDCMLDTDDILDMSSFPKAIAIVEKHV